MSDGNTKWVETVCLATFLIKRSILDEDLFANHKSSTLLHLLDSQGHFSFCSSQSRWDYRRWHLCLVVCSHCFASGRHHCLGVTYICKAIQNFKKIKIRNSHYCQHFDKTSINATPSGPLQPGRMLSNTSQLWIWFDDCIVIKDEVDNYDVIEKPVLGHGRSQRRYEMLQNPGQGSSLHIPCLWHKCPFHICVCL